MNFRKWEEGAGTSLWYSDKMDPAWVCKFTLNDDAGTGTVVRDGKGSALGHSEFLRNFQGFVDT